MRYFTRKQKNSIIRVLRQLKTRLTTNTADICEEIPFTTCGTYDQLIARDYLYQLIRPWGRDQYWLASKIGYVPTAKAMLDYRIRWIEHMVRELKSPREIEYQYKDRSRFS